MPVTPKWVSVAQTSVMMSSIEFKKIFLRLYLFLDRGEGREKERDVQEKHQLVASWAPSGGDLAHNPGMCPDQESNWWPSSFQASTQTTEPH